MLEAVLDVCNKNARIVACGMISQYNKTAADRDGVSNLFNVRSNALLLLCLHTHSYQFCTC